MTVGGMNGASGNVPAIGSGMNMQMDSVSKNIQNQIANAQKQLQEISSNEEMSLEDKMKKRQEIQKEITDLNQQLRQHQIEQRKEQQSKKSSTKDDMAADTKKSSAKKSSGLSQASMQAMISADFSMKQAQVQSGMATKMEGRAGVLKAEIETDRGRGASTERKEEELADLHEKVENTTAAQISTLAEAETDMKEAVKADQKTETTEKKTDKTQKPETEAEGKSDDVTERADRVSDKTTASKVIPARVVPPVWYTPIDVRL